MSGAPGAVGAPRTHYARNGDIHIAYHVVGGGDVDVMMVPPFISNIEICWELPALARFLRALGSFARLIMFDRRGCGCSDGAAGAATLEQQLDDIQAVLDATDASRPVLVAVNEGAALALLFAASHPKRVGALALMAPQARLVAGPGYEWAMPRQERRRVVEAIVEHWGEDSPENPYIGFAGEDAVERSALARFQRLAAGPGDAAAALELAGQTDVRDVLGSVQCPTLVIRRARDTLVDERHSRYVADQVPGASYLELPGEGQVWTSDPTAAADEVQRFLAGASAPAASERVLATVLFTDIVASTERAAELGDAGWRELLARHDELVAEQVRRHRGRLVKSLGDGALATFDGPSRALGAAIAIRDGVAALGLRVRAGVHTGECELVGADISGVAVHIGARLASIAAPAEILASRTVRDLTVGSPFELADRGEQSLKGIPEPCHVFAVRSPAGHDVLPSVRDNVQMYGDYGGRHTARQDG